MVIFVILVIFVIFIIFVILLILVILAHFGQIGSIFKGTPPFLGPVLDHFWVHFWTTFGTKTGPVPGPELEANPAVSAILQGVASVFSTDAEPGSAPPLDPRPEKRSPAALVRAAALIVAPDAESRAVADRLRRELTLWSESASPLPPHFERAKQDETIKRLKALGYIK